MDQSTLNKILETIGGLASDVRNLTAASNRMDENSRRDRSEMADKLDEVRSTLGTRVHDVNNRLMALTASTADLTSRVSKIEPQVRDLESTHLRNAGALSVGKAGWTFIVAIAGAAAAAVVEWWTKH